MTTRAGANLSLRLCACSACIRERVEATQALEAVKIRVGGVEDGVVFNSHGGKLRIGYEICGSAQGLE